MTVNGAIGPWSSGDPRRPHPPAAVVDDATAAVVAEATEILVLLRSPMRLGDGLAEVHAMVSLLAQIQASLPGVVAAARDQGHSWNGIAEQLGVSAGAARRRYTPHHMTTTTTKG